jgi:hypothetical protein
MKPLSLANYLILIAVFISSCDSGRSTFTPVQVETMSATLQTKQPTSTVKPTQTTPLPILSPTKQPTLTVKPTQTTLLPISSPTKHPTPTNTPLSTPITTLTLPPTLEPEQAMKTMSAFLQGSEYCEVPCFFGIVPGRTTLDEAKKIFMHLGLPIKGTTYQGKDIYGTHYNFESSLSIYGNLTVQNEIVRNLRIDIIPETSKAGTPREWLAFSPETLIRRYGSPSRVSFAVDWGPSSFFDMAMNFDAEELIVEYSGYDLIPRQKGSPVVCPLTARFDSVRLWMGKDPIYPPAEVVLLEKATSMTIEEFSNLMTGNPNGACFQINGDMFP